MSFACIGIYFFFNLLSLIWDGDQYTKTKIAVSPPGWARAMLILAWMCVCHVVFWLPESSSRASQKLKHKFSGDTAKLISAGEGSKALLSRVLPKELIPRVRKLQDGQAIADEFDNVTIIFAKVIGLHEMFETLPTVQVVGVIDRLFRQIDNLISEKHNKIEKIKTVGDTYMAGAGLPTPTDTHAIDLTHFAFALAEEIMKFNDHYRLGTEGRAEKLDYKIGISSGPIVAGVIGRANPVYDLWGDAANTASRMYSFGKKHRIQTTQATIDLIKQDFDYESRGIIWVKGKGDMEVFFVLGKIKLFLLFYFFQKVLNVYDTGGG
jgi:class 3 adenylate cyclase